MYADLLAALKRLPPARRAVLVVESMPFGAIIEDDTRRRHGVVTRIDGGPDRRIDNGDGTVTHMKAGSDWHFVAYGMVRAAKGQPGWESALRDAGYI